MQNFQVHDFKNIERVRLVPDKTSNQYQTDIILPSMQEIWMFRHFNISDPDLKHFCGDRVV